MIIQWKQEKVITAKMRAKKKMRDMDMKIFELYGNCLIAQSDIAIHPAQISLTHMWRH